MVAIAHLASADNLEFLHKRMTDQTTKPTSPGRLPPHEAVKFNDPIHRAAASDWDFRIDPNRPRRYDTLFVDIHADSVSCQLLNSMVYAALRGATRHRRTVWPLIFLRVTASPCESLIRIRSAGQSGGGVTSIVRSSS